MDLGLDPDLLDILACPAPDHGTLRAGTPEDADAYALTCTSCDRRFPVADGIPVLLLSEATGGPDPASPDPASPDPASPDPASQPVSPGPVG